jgi:hypothetical protein
MGSVRTEFWQADTGEIHGAAGRPGETSSGIGRLRGEGHSQCDPSPKTCFNCRTCFSGILELGGDSCAAINSLREVQAFATSFLFHHSMT